MGLATTARRPWVHVRVSAIRQAFQRAVDEHVFPGAVALVRSRGTVVFHEAVGTRGAPPDDQPVRLDSIYDLASLTKPLATSTAMLCLVQDGHLHLDQPVSQWTDELRESLLPASISGNCSRIKRGCRRGDPIMNNWRPRGYRPGMKKNDDNACRRC